MDWASPRQPTVRSANFKGLAGILSRFIEGFLRPPVVIEIAKSMTKLTQKGIKFDWGEKEENAFQLINQKLCIDPNSGFTEVIHPGKSNLGGRRAEPKKGLSHCGFQALVMTIGLEFTSQMEPRSSDKAQSKINNSLKNES
ncbi:hypothetical protein Tco_0007901 [Tanacetum coccineum]